MNPPLSDWSNVSDIKNIYIYVADSVRESATSSNVTSLGASGHAIAASTYTASSFPSIVSGQYPSSHLVWSFDNQLPDRPKLLTCGEEFGLFADTIWTDVLPEEKPPFQMICATGEDNKSIMELDPPFVAIEHDRGGHLPYGRSFDNFDSTLDFFNEKKPSSYKLSQMYKKGVKLTEERFLERIAGLKQRDLFDETLVIYTSDHGEILGELRNGITVGHGDPIVPELVDVPIVFAGAGLPDSELNCLMSGTDIAPTALSALGHDIPSSYDGVDLWRERVKETRRCRSELWLRANTSKFGEIERYRGASVWDGSGGYVFQQGSRLSRAAFAANMAFRQAPWSYLNRDLSLPYRFLRFAEVYLPSKRKHGHPGFSEDEAKSELACFDTSNIEADNKIDREQLQRLGYLE